MVEQCPTMHASSLFETLTGSFEILVRVALSGLSIFPEADTLPELVACKVIVTRGVETFLRPLLSHYGNISNNEFDIPSIIFKRFAYLKRTPKAYMPSTPPPPPLQYFAKCPPLF